MTGLIFDIKKFAVHDGPGIRTTVFLKGCPLKCVWCQNPEGISHKKNLWYFENRCIQCHQCIPSCPKEALTVSDRPHIAINKDLCDHCGICVNVCPTEALNFDSGEKTVEEVISILLEDQQFYDKSGGGITLSGGDPMYQYTFAIEILKAAKKEGLHTAIETSMFAKPEVFESFMDYVDFFIVDIKLMDHKQHKTYIGQDNQIILNNFRTLAASDKEILVRTPLIPGITDTQENIRAIAAFIKANRTDIQWEFINYNPFADNKYRLMGETYSLSGTTPLSDDALLDLYATALQEGIYVLRETKL